MLLKLLASLALLGAPEDDAAAKLRVAWASQYEWREDAVKNITLDFTYRGSWKGGEGQEFTYRGSGQIVVVDGEVVRVHLPDVPTGQRDRLIAEIDWILARFARKPFAEQFKDAKFGRPASAAGGATKLPVNDEAYLLKNDQIVGKEVNIGTPEKPFVIRLDFVVGPYGDGYGIREEMTSYTRKQRKTSESRLLKNWESSPPAPRNYTYERKERGSVTRLELNFEKAKIDQKDAVVLDGAARDLLKEAWARQYALPETIRIDGTFSRKVDKNLRKARWEVNAKGKFQVWGLDSIEVVVDENRGGKSVQDTCLGHLRGAFGLFTVKPFDEEFKGCGFGVEAGEKGEMIVTVIGHKTVLSYRLVEGAIGGRLDTGRGQDWWRYKLKVSGDAPVLIQRMTREVEGKKYVLNFKYGKVGGQLIPKLVSALATPTGGWRRSTYGVAEYRFSRLKVSLAKEGQ